jgi:Asp-tRNA(Asn)/Glu-tRNA(Gln) amidotransferase A subunit family amidase
MPEPLTITAAAPLLRTGELTPSELLEQCLRRIDIYEPAVKAWAYLDRERARQEAAKATDEIKAGHYRGPLHGIPIGVKDIIDVFDMPTGCGSKLWANSYARQDATCVERLRQAGAIILGKTVTTAYAYLDPPVTRNPWNLDRTPGGSSSGSAAAVACGMCLASLGTQTGGSTIRPASYCGVYALKPAWGRVSVEGVHPLAATLDHVGVMANTASDLATVYRVLSTFPLPDDPDGRHPPRFVQLGGLFADRADPVMRDALAHVLGLMAAAGADVQQQEPPDGFDRVTAAHRAVMASEAAAHHEKAFRDNPDHYPSRISELILEGFDRTAVQYVRCKGYGSWMKHLLTERDDARKVCFVTPAAPGPAPTPETTGDAVFNSPWSLFGLPVVTVPGGWSPDGLPLGVQLVGTSSFASARLLAWAEWCEQVIAMPRRLPPVPTA